MGALVNTLHRTLPGAAEQIPHARAWTLACLPASCPRAADVALVVTELVTNTVLHSSSGQPGGTFELQVDLTDTQVQLTVTDQGPPATTARRDPDECGRGLELVAALADSHDITDTPAGRTVRCRFEI